MASTFKMEPMTYRVGPKYFNERSRSGSWASTFNDRVKRKGYESATAVYGPEYMTKGSRGNKGRMTKDLIGYDAVAMTRVEYRPAPAPAKSIAEAAPKETPGKGANRGTVGSLGTATGAGVAGTAQAGNVGSVNTEVQNDDAMMPYMKENR